MEIPDIPAQPLVREQEPEPEPEKPQAIEKDQVFRFMDLPGGEHTHTHAILYPSVVYFRSLGLIC
jgi:hypothetical protein